MRGLRAILGATVALAWSATAAAQAIAPAAQTVLFQSNPCAAAGAALKIDFIAGSFCRGDGSSPSFLGLRGVTFTRASAAYDDGSCTGGQLVLYPANALRIDCNGLLVEDSRTNVVLWDRDLTNAAWTKTNVTAALNQAGVDGGANSASSLTASAANGTALQAITLASSVRFETVYVKRLAGTGVVNMTMDGGTTWTPVTVTGSYSRVSIPTQTLANPSVGFQIVTNGDSIAVDFVQNENGNDATTAIATTSAAATRQLDDVEVKSLSTYLGGPFSFTVRSAAVFAQGGQHTVVDFDGNGSGANRLELYRTAAGSAGFISNGGTGGPFNIGFGSGWTVGVQKTVAARAQAANVGVSLGGGTAVDNSIQTVLPVMNLMLIGSGPNSAGSQRFQSIFVYSPRAMSDAELQAASQ